jgi:CDP-glycerol glycerophosphotransferase
MRSIFILIIGTITYLISKVVKTKNKVWIYGANHGKEYSDNSKFFFNYVRNNNSNIKSIWLTRSRKVFHELKSNNIPVVYNISVKGIYYCLVSDVIVFCTSRDDLLFIYPKLNRKIVNLWHGMPIKKVVFDFEPHTPKNRSWKSKVSDIFVTGFQHSDVDLIPSTSNFYKNILKSAFRTNNVFVTGQPRTDSFFEWDSLKIRNKYGFSKEEKIITYMPTHRAYGSGKMNPRIFINNIKAISFFKENNIKIIWKFHPNMINNSFEKDVEYDTKVFKDLTLANIDPQELLFISDMLVTDYSSCYIDFLFLKRPIAFYLYDNYESEDNELYFSPKDHNVGEVCSNEKKVLEWVKKNKDQTNFNYGSKLSLYHKDFNQFSCENIFKIILK